MSTASTEHFYLRKIKTLLIVIMCGAFVLFGSAVIAMAVIEGERGIVLASGVIMVSFGLLYGAKWLRHLISGKPLVAVSPDGLTVPLFAPATIPWKDIEMAFIMDVENKPFLCIDLLDAEPYLSQRNAISKALYGLSRKADLGDVWIPLSSLDTAAVERLRGLLRDRLEAKELAIESALLHSIETLGALLAAEGDSRAADDLARALSGLDVTGGDWASFVNTLRQIDANDSEQLTFETRHALRNLLAIIDSLSGRA